MNFYHLKELVSGNEEVREISDLPFRELFFRYFKTDQILIIVGGVLPFSCQNLGYGVGLEFLETI